MAHQDDTVPIDPPERRAVAGPALPAPNFDAGSVRRARAAVPLEPETRWDGKLPWIVVALVAGMIGGLLGIWALSYYQGADDGARTASQSTTPTTPQPAATQPAGGAGADAQPKPPPSGDQAQAQATPAAEATPADEGAGGASPASAEEEGQLRAALSGWIGATNARDIDRQMSFYDSRVSTFYLARGASRAAVRAEKSAVFARASKVEVRADPPQIFLSRDGRTATMRFRKQFAIEGGGIDRRGAVLQELRWRRTPEGWKIVGERDLQVVD